MSITVTKPFLPPQEEYQEKLLEIWGKNWLTNHGPLLQKFEEQILIQLGVNYFHFVANGTIALQVALHALNITGDIITTPFSFVATTNAILWEHCKPIFVDIAPDTLNIDCNLIEEAITDNTKAILVTHIYGNACDIEAIQTIADKHNLKVIYDAAHCFGTKYKGKSIFTYGDISITSFHATKIFHTIEGGGIFSNNKAIDRCVRKYSNFGFDVLPTRFVCPGINAKNSEFHAAMGLCNLKYIKDILQKRKKQWNSYKDALKRYYKILKIDSNTDFNCAYFPLVFESEKELIEKMRVLKEKDIFIRRYFYPALSKLPYLDNIDLPVVDDIAPRVVCLPLFHDMLSSEQEVIIETLLC